MNQSPRITTTFQGGMFGDARRAARRLAWERLPRSLHSWFRSSHRSNSSGPNRSRGSISRTTRQTCGRVIRGIFLTCEPLAGWRHVAITQRHTMQDFAHQMQWLVDVDYPDATVVRVVLDNLNTYRMASLYETFPAAEARRIVRRLEFHHPPKHASWLNMAEIEFSVLTRACLKGRNPDETALQRAINAYEAERNVAGSHHQLAVQHP